MNKIWYFPLEPVNGRYTHQLSNYWLPDAFNKALANNESKTIISIEGIKLISEDIQVGKILDATGRGIYSLSQVQTFLEYMHKGEVKDYDVLFFSDFWTPGIEAIFYAAQLYSIKLKIYSICWAQSFDIYDFTYPMKYWIRPIELSYASMHTGIFVASSVLKELLQISGITCPIHVISLPISYYEINNRMYDIKKQNLITYVSRFDYEKQPEFMLEVAMKFLESHSEYFWAVSTSRNQIYSDIPFFVDNLYSYAKRQSRLLILCNQSKDNYYKLLSKSKANFNCALQDWVSFTLLEACIANCDIVYPAFRSFIECVPHDRLYLAFDVKNALDMLKEVIHNPTIHLNIPVLADCGRLKLADIVVNDYQGEYNIFEENKI